MISDISSKTVSHILRALNPETPVTQRWSSDPWFQRQQVWDISRKRKLIDSAKKGMPFGMVWIWTHEVNGVLTTDIIDGKQRCTTLASFKNGDFRDSDDKYWSDWSDLEQFKFCNQNVAVMGVTLEGDESNEVVVELFRRINTQSKQLTPGQLLKSCYDEDVLKFIRQVFFEDIDEEGRFAEDIKEFRSKWAKIFCKTEFSIKSNTSNGELTFLAGLVVPFLTGKNEAITTSFDIISNNGLRDTIDDAMKETFFLKMNGDSGFLEIAEFGWDVKQFKKSAKGYPSFGKITPIIYMVNKAHTYTSNTDDADAKLCFTIIPHMENFYEKLSEDEDLDEEWTIRFRRNRNIETLRCDIEFIFNTITEEDEE